MPLLLTQDPRWPDFARRYAFNISRFAIEVCGMTPTWQQVELFEGVQDPGSRTTVSSGHGTGKTRSIGVASLWHLLCYYKSNTMITAPKIATVRDTTWKEIEDVKELIERGPHAWIAQYFAIEAERIYVRGFKLGWYVIAKTAPRGSPENLAGMHRDWYLVIADEASGIPDANFGVLTGALTDDRNRMLLTSQPTRDSGFFYDTHHTLSTRSLDANGIPGVWKAIVMNSEQSPRVGVKFVREKLAEYGGRDSVEYQIKVLGRFPENNDKYLLGRALVEERVGAQAVITADMPFGYILSVDVGAGEYRDKSVAVLAKVWGEGELGETARRVEIVDIPLFTNTRNIQDFTGMLYHLATSIDNCTVMVDAGGVGIAVCQALEALGLPLVKRVKWGNPCFRTRYKERFFNQRAQAIVQASRAVREKRIVLSEKYKKDLLDQASRMPYHFDEKARYVIMKKEDMRSEGLPSPDLWDAISFLFLEDATYMQAEASYGQAGDRLKAAESRADDALSDIS